MKHSINTGSGRRMPDQWKLASYPSWGVLPLHALKSASFNETGILQDQPGQMSVFASLLHEEGQFFLSYLKRPAPALAEHRQ
jgi:hypothetical protein